MADIVTGGSGTNGLVTVNGTDGLPLVQLIASATEAKIGAGQNNGRPGHLQMYDGSSQLTCDLNAADATLTLGGSSTDGTVTVSGTDGQPLIQLIGSATESRIGMGQRNGRPGHLQMYDGNGQLAFDLSAANTTMTVSGTDGQPLIQLIGSATESRIGMGQRNGRPGHLQMYDGNSQLAFDLNAANTTVTVSGTDGQPLIQLIGSATESRIGMGQKNGRPGRIQMYDGNGNLTVDINAAGGDIALNGDLTLAAADCAEQFDMQDATSAEPGTIVVIDDEGKLRESQCAYDKRVAGVVSGAGDYRPGIVLDKQASSAGRASVALVGKVYCKVDADFAPITVGDLLTSSARAGFAMKATDPAQAFGAVIGKALRPLRAGQGMIPILVALQ
jgi:hypothetical protein